MADYDFIRLTFDGKTTEEFNLYVVSNSGRYTAPLSPQFENRTTSVPGRPGVLYWGTNLGVQELTISLATDGMTGVQLNLFKKHFAPGKLGELTFAESFYKTYRVMLSSPPNLSHLPFINSQGDSIYKGEIELTMTTITPYAYSSIALYDAAVYGQTNPNRKESGLPVLTDFPQNTTYYHIANNTRVKNRAVVLATDKQTNIFSIYAYHAGNAPAPVNFKFNKTYTLAAASGSTPPKSNWVDITIGPAKLIKPRFIVDIEYMLQVVYAASTDWTNKKASVLNTLRAELTGAHGAALIALVNAYTTFSALYTSVNTTYFSTAVYNFSINAITNQCTLQVKIGTAEPYTYYDEDNSGSFNGQFIKLNPSGILPVVNGAQLITSSQQINNVEVIFKNTYI